MFYRTSRTSASWPRHPILTPTESEWLLSMAEYSPKMTPQKLQILRLFLSGLSCAQIANEIKRSPHRVYCHLRSCDSSLEQLFKVKFWR